MSLRLLPILILAVALSVISCQIEGADGCEVDGDCRFDRICVDGVCEFSGNARPSGTQADLDSGSGDDRTAADTHRTIDQVPPPNVSLEAFCQGGPQFALVDQVVSPVHVTGEYMPLRSCCEDLSLRFHTGAERGFEVALAVGWCVGAETTVVDLQNLPEGFEVSVCRDRECQQAALSGRLNIAFDDEHGATVSVCAQVEEADHELFGARFASRDTYVAPWSWTGRFQVWMLADPGLTGTDAYSQPLDTLELGQPVLDLMGASFYDPATFELGLNQSAEALLGRLRPVEEHGIPFVVTADEDRIFQGAFWTGESDTCPEQIAVYIEPPRDDRVIIHWGCSSPPPDDPRLDPRLLTVFREAGRLLE